MDRKQTLLALSILCIAGAVCTINAAAINDKTVSYPDPKRWSKEADAFEQWDRKNSYPQNAVLFAGSSSIVQWSTASAFPDFPVINRGFGGSVMADLVYYVDAFVLKYQPKVVVVYSGDNDCAAGIPPQSVAGDFKTVADKIHAALPTARIICLSVKLSDARKDFWSQMRQVNKLYKQYAETKEYITYVDLNVLLQKEDGTPDPVFFLSDRLHLSEKGYAVWNKSLSAIIKEQYGPASSK
jgi:lysophospholipase L1-like esterase